MNVSRYLLAIPVVFAASITAAACSSSSSSDTVPDSGTSVNADCATLAACCALPTFPSTSLASCEKVVAAGGSACTASLAQAKSANLCSATGTGPGSGTGTGTGTGTGPGTGTGTGVGTGTGTGTGGTDASAGGCNPQPVTGMTFTAKTLFPSVCTAAEVDAFVTDCFGTSDTDAAISACNSAISAPDGSLNSCGQCGLSDAQGASWGAFVVIVAPTAVGATTGTELTLFDEAACIAAVDPSSAGQACAAALEEQEQCEFAACLASCPVASDTDQAGEDALLGTSSGGGCLSNADTSVCMTQASAAQTACAGETNSGMTGAADKCNTLLTTANAATPTAASTTAFEQYVGLLCGGVDAGL